MSETDQLAAKLLALQAEVRIRLGHKADTSAGAATLSIAHDRVEMTDGHCEIVARGALEVAEYLEGLL